MAEPRPGDSFSVSNLQSPISDLAHWSLPKLILFRFLFAYAILYTFPFPLDLVPWVGDHIVEPWSSFWMGVATRVFGIAGEVQQTGSGDMTWNYAQMACFLGVAAIVAIVWSVFDRKRANYVRLHQYLHAYIRFVLATAMFSYGIAKVIPTQFPPPMLDRLVQTYGSSSPMGLVWTFMGASTAYVIFTGMAETLSGLLLIARRTSLLGALVGMAVMANIMALNFFYDVPVKLYSTHLFLMAVFIAAPDARKLLDFFVLRPPEPLFRSRGLHVTSLVLRTVLVIAVIGLTVQQTRGYYHQLYDMSARSPLRGIWNIDVLTVDGVARPPLVTDATRWRRIVFDMQGPASIFLMNDDRLRYGARLDPKTNEIHFVNRYEALSKFTLKYSRPNPRTLQLDGTVDGKKIHAVCKLEEKKFLLTDRGFHWINERPFNK